MKDGDRCLININIMSQNVRGCSVVVKGVDLCCTS
jgi:hypothetical protein